MGWGDNPDAVAVELTDDDIDSYAEGWHVETDAHAEWALTKLAEAEAEVLRITRLHDAEMERVHERTERLLKGPTDTVRFFTGHLVAYHQRVSPEGKRRTLINGDLTSRAGSDELVIEDEELLTTYLESEDRPDLLRTTTAPRKTAIKKFMADNGVLLLPGARIERRERTWTPRTERPV